LPPDERDAAAKAIIKKLRWKQPWFMTSAIGREGTWPICLEVQKFFDAEKAAAAERARDAELG